MDQAILDKFIGKEVSAQQYPWTISGILEKKQVDDNAPFYQITAGGPGAGFAQVSFIAECVKSDLVGDEEDHLLIHV